MLAGSVGTLALEATTYGDMLLSGRPASKLPEQAAERTLVSIRVPDGKLSNRTAGLSHLMGYATGVSVGGAAGLLGEHLDHLNTVARGLVLAGAAMVAGQVPAVLSGLTDPRRWSRRQWLEDIVPHLVYGLAASVAIERIRGGRAG